MSPMGGAKHPGWRGWDRDGGVPTLTLLNWEAGEVSLSVLLPAPRVLLSSAAGSGGAPSITTSPLPAPRAPRHHARLLGGGAGYTHTPRHPLGKHQPTPEEGPRCLVLGAESCQHLTVSAALRRSQALGAENGCSWVQGRRGQRDVSCCPGSGARHRCPASVLSPGAAMPRNPSKDGPHPGGMWVLAPVRGGCQGGNSPPCAAQSSQRRGPMAGGDAVCPCWRGGAGRKPKAFIARISRRSGMEEAVTVQGSLAPSASSVRPARCWARGMGARRGARHEAWRGAWGMVQGTGHGVGHGTGLGVACCTA